MVPDPLFCGFRYGAFPTPPPGTTLPTKPIFSAGLPPHQGFGPPSDDPMYSANLLGSCAAKSCSSSSRIMSMMSDDSLSNLNGEDVALLSSLRVDAPDKKDKNSQTSPGFQVSPVSLWTSAKFHTSANDSNFKHSPALQHHLSDPCHKEHHCILTIGGHGRAVVHFAEHSCCPTCPSEHQQNTIFESLKPLAVALTSDDLRTCSFISRVSIRLRLVVLHRRGRDAGCERRGRQERGGAVGVAQ